MQLFKKFDGAKALEDILIKERSAILNGNFAALSTLMTKKEHFAATADSVLSIGDLARLRQLSIRNQAMLLAASEGIRTVTKLLSQQKSNGTELQTYSETGELQRRDSCQNKMARRV